MILEPQEIVSGKNLSAKSSEIDFAIVLSRVIGSIENDPAQLRNAVAAPLARAAVVAILAVLLCAVLYRQFGFFGRQGPHPFASVHKIERPQAKPVVQASADDLQLPITTPSPRPSGFPLPTVYGIYAVSGGQLFELEPLVGRVPD